MRAMRPQLKIRHRGLIIVAVPLLLEFVLLAGLASLLHQAETEIQQEAHSKEVVMHANILLRQLVSASTRLLSFYMRKDPRHFRFYLKRREEVNEEIAKLNTLLSDQPLQLEHMAKTARDVNTLFEVFNKIEQFADQPMGIASMLRGKEFFSEMQTSMDRVSNDLNPLIVAEQRIVEASPATRVRSRQQIQAVIFGGMLLTVMLAFYLTSLFSKGITSRLQFLTDNTGRLAKKLPLAPPMQGSDEIASLDRVFHEMADALAEAGRKEREAMERVRLIIASMPVGLLVIDRNGVIDFVNSTTEEMFRFSSPELVGQHLSKLFPSKTARSPEEFMMQVYPKSLGKISELMASRKGDEEFPVQFSLTELQMIEGTKILAIFLDMTERYEIQKLRQTFVAMVSHDLRNPLTSVQNFLNMLTIGAFGEVSQKASNKAKMQEENIERLMSLINDLLDLEKIESGVIHLKLAPVSIHSVIQHSIEAVRSWAERNRVNIVQAGSEVKIIADGDRLVQVVTNLLSNAIKYSPPESIVTVDAREDSGWIEVRVKDCGPGIPPRHQEIIFERFQQVESPDGVKRPGTGLGLAICKTIVEQHGGSIGVDSEEDKGSEFWFRVPRTTVAEQVNS